MKSTGHRELCDFPYTRTWLEQPDRIRHLLSDGRAHLRVNEPVSCASALARGLFMPRPDRSGIRLRLRGDGKNKRRRDDNSTHHHRLRDVLMSAMSRRRTLALRRKAVLQQASCGPSWLMSDPICGERGRLEHRTRCAHARARARARTRRTVNFVNVRPLRTSAIRLLVTANIGEHWGSVARAVHDTGQARRQRIGPPG